MTEKEMIVELIKNEHQVCMDGVIWVYQLGPIAQDQCGQYNVLTDLPDIPAKRYDDAIVVSSKKQEVDEVIFNTPEEAADEYLRRVNSWLGRKEK